MPSPPSYSPDTVFFIGNGVLRVPSWIRDFTDDEAPHGDQPLPSWNQYMDTLWSLADRAREPGTSDFLGKNDFAKLSAPRQAEWFDRQISTVQARRAGLLASGLRLHLLGNIIHRRSGILTNDLIEMLSRIILQPLWDDGGTPPAVLDVMTTNLDCSLEQNLALAAERLVFPARPLRELRIEVIVGMQPSVIWRREGSGDGQVTIRLWKLHGCLREIGASLRERKDEILAWHRRLDPGAKTRDEPFAGHVPGKTLAPHGLLEPWRGDEPSRSPRSSAFTGVFAQSEYFGMVARLLAPGKRKATGTEAKHLAVWTSLLAERPLVFVGYALAEDDVDVVAALHRWRPGPGKEIGRSMLRAEKPSSRPSEAERLRQMGIDWWGFELPPVAFCPLPGTLSEISRRHEWRDKDEEPWRTRLLAVSSEAWLRPQIESLQTLLRRPVRRPPKGRAAARRHRRLVFAGLGSIWHGFALLKPADFPNKRRATARMVAVDSQVPGGSGLVPLMVAAAMAGPQAAGQLSFFSNVPGGWSGWPEIRELCLSAGVAVYPWTKPEKVRPAPLAVGRTSHVLLFDDTRNDSGTVEPRQRFIMDVQSMSGQAKPPSGEINVPKVVLRQEAAPRSLDRAGYGDLLFADKEVDPASLGAWNGPVIYETGATGPEFATALPTTEGHRRPNVWTAGMGSFVRTLSLLAGHGIRSEDQTQEAILGRVDSQPDLREVCACPDHLRARYVARLLGFATPVWKRGFSHQDEVGYGRWLLREWTRVAPAVARLLRLHPGERDESRLKIDPAIGRGVLVTSHEAGLMALWEREQAAPAGGGQERVLEAIVVRAVAESQPTAIQDGLLRFEGEVTRVAGQPIRSTFPTSRLRIIPSQKTPSRITPSRIELTIDGHAGKVVLPSDPSRRNTLGAGDSVRGALAYGLWLQAREEKLADQPKIDFAYIVYASCVLASVKCYTGSFVNFLEALTELRRHPLWHLLWSAAGRNADEDR